MKNKISVWDKIRLSLFPILPVSKKPSVRRYLQEKDEVNYSKRVQLASNGISKVK